MKGLFTTIVTAFAAVAALMFAAHSFAQGPDRDWEKDIANTGNGGLFEASADGWRKPWWQGAQERCGRNWVIYVSCPEANPWPHTTTPQPNESPPLPRRAFVRAVYGVSLRPVHP